MPITIIVFLKRYISRKIQNVKTGHIGLMNMTVTIEKLKYELNIFFPQKRSKAQTILQRILPNF